MTIDTELKKLVTFYASYDKEKKCYSSNLTHESLLALDADFIKLINKLLLQNGPDKDKIKKCYRILALAFHPDHLKELPAETQWLEARLSENRNDGTCFKTLTHCYQKLINPQEFKPINFDDITTKEDLKIWLENLKKTSRTFTERNFYASLLGLLEQSTSYFDETGQIKPTGVRALVTFLPMVFISFGTIVFAEELFAVYALYFALLKGGQFIECSSSSKELRKIGITLQKISVITATATTTLLVRLMEMTFWATSQCYDISLQIGSALLTPLITASPTTQSKNTAADVN